MTETSVEFPKYRCHKEVEAFKIVDILARVDDKFALLWFDESGHDVHTVVNREYMAKHNPQIGGYYVRYKDGYESFSPAKPFEEGYTKI